MCRAAAESQALAAEYLPTPGILGAHPAAARLHGPRHVLANDRADLRAPGGLTWRELNGVAGRAVGDVGILRVLFAMPLAPRDSAAAGFPGAPERCGSPACLAARAVRPACRG